MNSVAERAPDIRSRGDRRGICSHCGWYDRAPNERADDTPVDYIAGGAISTPKYRIIM